MLVDLWPRIVPCRSPPIFPRRGELEPPLLAVAGDSWAMGELRPARMTQRTRTDWAMPAILS